MTATELFALDIVRALEEVPPTKRRRLGRIAADLELAGRPA